MDELRAESERKGGEGSALTDLDSVDERGSAIRLVPLQSVVPNPSQPRKTFRESDIQELASSIRNMGVIQPIVVRPCRNDPSLYEIVAGERRWRAAKVAGLADIPVIIRNFSDWEALEAALMENVQRADLNPIEEAKGYKSLMDRYSLTQKDVAERIGKDRATVANLLRLLALEEEIQEMVADGRLSTGHAKALLSVRDSRARRSLARKAIKESLSVRALEKLVSQTAPLEGAKAPALKGKGLKQSRFTDYPEIVDKLRAILGTKVLIKNLPNSRGKIEIHYFSQAELNRLVEILLKSRE
ncbi:MAG: ParB/RepB/Spo0J family partition protein [Candidatus Dadabacteria bacterium]|nr:MAG: ParB/RepB/Spo0J family partition protein [Candidatus Dadabacteria bacterium]